MQNKRNGLKMISLVCGSFIDTVHCDRLVNSTKPLALADSKTQSMTRDKISRPVHPNLRQNVCCPCHILAKLRAVKTPFAMHTFDRSKVHLTWRKCCASKSAVESNSALSEFWMPPNTRPSCTSDFYEISKLVLLWPLETRGETKIGSDNRLISDRLAYYSASTDWVLIDSLMLPFLFIRWLSVKHSGWPECHAVEAGMASTKGFRGLPCWAARGSHVLLACHQILGMDG